MNWLRRWPVWLAALLLLALSASPSVIAQSSNGANKIAPWVMAHTQNGAQAEFLVALPIRLI